MKGLFCDEFLSNKHAKGGFLAESGLAWRRTLGFSQSMGIFMSHFARRSSLLLATSCLSLSFATLASANDENDDDLRYEAEAGIDLSTSGTPLMFADNFVSRADFLAAAEDEPGIVIRNDINPNGFPPSGAYDPVNITGVGQMVVDYGAGGLGTCTGTLINPRTVIFAAHCVNSNPKSSYGAATGGRGISFGFQQYNVPGLLKWLGISDPALLYKTDVATAIYNVEDVWYDDRSLRTGFLEADIALATLDTPAFGIPTWAMLFTPLDGQEHVTVTGYGSIGNGTTGYVSSGAWRRRVAENYVSFLGSLDDRNSALYGSTSGLPQNLYMSAFTSPQGWNPANGSYDFGIFGANDTVLPREGITGSGDSGGPLILDQKYDMPLILGVLSGGSRFFGPQNFGAYGTHSFYQPLHAFWDTIVANNPYVYATNKEGDGEWTDGAHWIQEMDPAYQIVVDGELVNGLPSVAGEALSGEGAKFGDVCFLGDCVDFTDPGESTVGGEAFFVEGGPGSTNFVPNNITANPVTGIRPRYYDVTLSARGTTTLRGANVTIDLLTMDGPTKLDIASGASLRALGEFNQFAGWTNVDGLMQASEVFVMTGFLTGNGTLRAPFVTTAAAVVAPGGADKVGTLTIDGNMIMASGSALFIDASRNGADRLAVTGGLSLSDPASTESVGPTLVFSKTPDSPAPRFGQTFTIVTANGGIEGTFGSIASFQGVLRPELTYGETTIVANLRAGAFVDIIDQNDVTANAFAAALDTLRDGSYDALYDFYGAIDLMDGASLTTLFNGLAPDVSVGSQSLQQRQSRMLTSAVTDRLSVMGGDAGGSLAIVGAPETLRMGLTALSGQRNVRMGIADLAPSQGGSATQLPEGMSGFVAGGTYGARQADAASFTDGGQVGSYFGMGLEQRVSDKASFGVAVGHAHGREVGGGLDMADIRTTQVAAYGAYDLGSNAYVGGIASLETVEANSEQGAFGGAAAFALRGATEMQRYSVNAEVGINLPVAQGLTLTPRAQLGYDTVSLGGYEQQGTQAALAIDDVRTESLTARAGFKLAGSHALANGWTLTPQMRADYVHRVHGGDNGLTVRFAAADSVAIALPLSQGEGSWGEVRGGLTVDNGTVSFGAGFETAIDRRALRDDRAMVEMGVRF